ncbi:uncharacterized protein LOC120346156 [Styela clava]
MKKKSAKSRSRTPSAEKKRTPEENEPPPEDPLPPPIDAQKLTLSDQEVLDVDLELTPTRILPDGTVEGIPFVPDDASSDAEEEGDMEEGGAQTLNHKMMSKALSNLTCSADGSKITFLNLSLPGFGIRDVSILKEYIHLQKVELQYNNISDLSPLSAIKYLIELDVSHNEIENLLDFEPPFNLRVANFSHNEISEIPDISQFPFIQTLNLDHNHITCIKGLEKCKSLQTLCLAYNRIENISGLDNLKISFLSLGHNSILEISGIETLKRLQAIDLSGNRIASLSGLENHDLLSDIDLEDNQIGNIDEIEHITKLELLRKLNLMRNPIGTLEEYRLHVLFRVPQLVELDHYHVKVEEKISAVNLFDSPPELQATLDHITHTVYNFLQPKKIYECTLPNITMPYPMLVLTGPQASGKSELCHRLVQEFPDFFGYGISHTTRVAGQNEMDGKDYYFISKDEFHNLVRQGCFIQTCKIGDAYYGLSMDAIENVAKEGLACVVHMEIEGVRTLKNTHFEPRYVLIMPFDPDVHEQKLMENGNVTEVEIQQISKSRANMYKDINQDNPGYFDMTINGDKLAEAYDRLRQLVMDYLGMSEATDFLTPTNQPTQLSTTALKDDTTTQHTNTSGNMRRTWSRPSFIVDSTAGSNDALSSKQATKSVKTPVEEASIRRRESAAKEAIEGTPYGGHFDYFPRPMVPMTAPAILEGSPLTQAASMYQDPSFVASTLYPIAGTNLKLGDIDSSSDTSSDTARDSTSSLSGLSSARDFSEADDNPIEKNKGGGIKVPGLPTLSSTDFANEPLDLSALSDALESFKGSLEGATSPHVVTPLTPRPFESETLNTKPVLPPINPQVLTT